MDELKTILLVGVLVYFNILFMTSNSSSAEMKKLPIIYSDEYNISFYGLENLHPFDSKKYGRVFEFLAKKRGITLLQVHQPAPVTDDELLRVHTQAYLNSLRKADTAAQIAEMPLLGFVPDFLVKKCLLNPMRLATGGSLRGVDLALRHGWAINLSGGYHHAKSDSGEGFCFFADIPLAVKKLHEMHPDHQVLIIDLDAHQGNGVSSILHSDGRVHIFDVYNAAIYPNDKLAESYVEYKYPVPAYIQDDDYLGLIEQELPKAIESSRADFILYNAGTDIYEKDPLGAMGITHDGIIRRDEIVFHQAIKRNIPILMLLSGGYTRESAGIIADSIDNLLEKTLPVTN